MQRELKQYSKAWYEKMQMIWRDRLDAMNSRDSGKGYKRGNGGDLEFLDPVYRHEHRLGKKRQRKPWFNKSWYISTMVLKDKLADVAGEEFAGLFDNLTQRERR